MASTDVSLKMPELGFGICNINDEAVLKTAIETALDAGYRMFDSAYIYKEEVMLGRVLKQLIDDGKIKRSEVFLVSHLLYNGMDPKMVKHFCELSLKNLQTEYLDLYLIHCPVSTEHTGDDNDVLPVDADGKVKTATIDPVATWESMEALVKDGKTRHIGLSNFNKDQIEKIWAKATIKPLYLHIECHVFLPQDDLVSYCKTKGISVTAYAPLGSKSFPEFARTVLNTPDYFPPTLITDERLVPIAKKHGKTSAQVLLRFLVQRGIAVIPRSGNPEHIKENAQVFDFELQKEDLEALKAMDSSTRYFTLDWWKGFKDHEQYPF